MSNKPSKLLTFALWVFFSGLSIGVGIILYIVIGYGNFETHQFEYLNSGLFWIVLGIFSAYISDRKYKVLRDQYSY